MPGSGDPGPADDESGSCPDRAGAGDRPHRGHRRPQQGDRGVAVAVGADRRQLPATRLQEARHRRPQGTGPAHARPVAAAVRAARGVPARLPRGPPKGLPAGP
ncbi:hypothetical protein SBRY_20181 [Actinacidiphila bryophytorum]|uniref:Uncharacterized protein n=1 Tax=Actinacidiphila bryophytorum TaxID=1436133 RepID=A0A9W4E721_9ACTN|nr:hypothetical protein SBRY_20181 [Actinacidiphila bryophytorum]